MIGPNDRTFFSKDGNFHLAQGTIFESRKRGAAAIFWDQLSIIKLTFLRSSSSKIFVT